MLTWEEDVQADALRKRGWSITAIAAHLGRDRKTIRAYLNGERVPGRRRLAEDHFAEFERYVKTRFVEDPHVPSVDLFDEVAKLGYPRSYQTFTRQVRLRGLRPVCVACQGVSGRATIDIGHEPGGETQWDWVELPGAPWLDSGLLAHVLVGTLAFSSQCRAVFAESEDQPHLIQGLDGVLRRLGGVTRGWRFDRMTTVVYAGSDRILPSFAAVAKHYGAEVAICPAYRPNRKGGVEKSVHLVTQRWWRTAEVATPEQAQASLDAFCADVADRRVRHRDRRRPSVGELAALEGLRAVPEVAFPAVVRQPRRVGRDATVAFEGNRYGVPAVFIGASVVVRHRLGSEVVEVATEAGLVAAAHQRAVPGAHRTVRSDTQRAGLERVVLAGAADQAGRPCHRKPHRPPGEAAKAEADRLRQRLGGHHDEVVIDLAAYTRLVDGDDEPAGGEQ